MAEQPIFLVIAVLIGAAILFLLLGVLTGTQGGITNLQETGKSYTAEIASKTIKDACNRWLYGANKYVARDILNVYELPQKAKPFPVLDCCTALGRTTKKGLGDIAQEVMLACAKDANDAKNCNDGQIDLGKTSGGKKYSTIVSNCESACAAVENIYEQCRQVLRGGTEAQISNCMYKSLTHTGTKGLCGATKPTIKIDAG